MAKIKMMAAVTRQEQLADGIFDMRIQAPGIAAGAIPGQFVSLYSGDGSRILPRPISLCGIDREEGELRLVYRVAGAGTKEFSSLRPGDAIEVLGPLGNGFTWKPGTRVCLVGGGIGIPPLLELAKAISLENASGFRGSQDRQAGEPVLVRSVLGYRNSQLFLKEEFEVYGPVHIATEDGSRGTMGNVMDVIRGIRADVIYACGPTPMLRALKVFGAEHGIPCYLSLEEKMACGVGACLACVCGSKEIDSHSQVHNKRVCKDGPVFLAEEIEL